jgi:hypothetical protein
LEENNMKRFAIRTLCVVALLASIPAVASAQGGPRCSLTPGEFAYTKTGTLLPPTGPVPYAAVGKLTVEPGWTLSGLQDSSTGGIVLKNALIGTVSLQADCTATATVGVYDESGTTLLRTAVMTLIADDNGREVRGIVTQLTLPNGYVVPQAITVVGRKVLNNRGNGR